MKGFWAFLIGSALTCSAQTNLLTFTNTQGRVIQDAKVLKVTPDAVLYSYSGGGGRLAFKDAPESVRKQFGYNPAAAAQFEAQQLKTQAEKGKQAAERQRAVAAMAASQKFRTRADAAAMVVEGKVLQNVPEGILINSASEAIAEQKEFERLLNSNPGVRAGTGTGKFYSGKHNNLQIYQGLCLLVDYPKSSSVVDNDVLSVKVYPAGEYKYGTVNGSSKTVRKFTTNIINAVLDGDDVEAMRREKKLQ